MARNVKPLTFTEVNKAKPKEKEYTLSDGQGLMLSIRPSGSKVWLFKYQKPFTKKRTNISFGSFPEISIADARKLRLEALTLLAKQIDPREHKQQQTQGKLAELEHTFEKISESWMTVKKSTVSENYATDIWRSFELHVFPKMGKLPISKLTAIETINTLKPIAAKGSLETVKRLCQRINEVMDFAVNTGIINSNPLSKIHSAFHAPKKKNMPTITPEELPQFMTALSRANMKLTTRCLIEWQLHTMTRPNESSAAQWAEIDWEKEVWVVPAERMKNRREHSIPLTPQMLELLDVMKPISAHREFIFPADRDPKKPTNSQTANAAIKRMGYQGKLVSHGLRAIASTALNEQGFNPDVIEAALSHVDGNEVRRAYNRTDYLEQRRPVMCWWSEYIEAAARGLSNNTLSTRNLRVIGD
ncbi:integrase domain-containing protein [Vibrio parahaemolyticus]|nr:tyrosine-type recombinase/integrase [Vibrio parahaemolyticus]MCF9078087.1 tyrosine-type recombinase/integrase [Vibrio parahaemolyticus]HCE2377600.1 tyrosine-type recombinase/integrase [Vibrio parahaemolyticus]HCE2587037.1 tyrosine-type recombinase/integrase [Vibrio parahaemolyticus]HCG8726315.1 tyrosine-type recombinase/integrase [Vibrio parahaemolyticus]